MPLPPAPYDYRLITTMGEVGVRQVAEAIAHGQIELVCLARGWGRALSPNALVVLATMAPDRALVIGMLYRHRDRRSS